jgi:adenine-specific DNA-methyltransferase
MGFRAFKLSPSNFKVWRGDFIHSEQDLITQTKLFKTQIKEAPKLADLLWELLIKNGFPLTAAINSHTVDDSVFFSIAENRLVVVLEKYTDEILKHLIALKPKTLICLDALFNGDDSLKTNAILKLVQAEIEFHSV